MKRLPVLETISTAIGAIHRNWFALVQALAIPAIIITAAEWIQMRFTGGLFSAILFWAISAPFYVIFAVVCHRTVILGKSAIPNPYGLFWSERETRFFGWTIVLIVMSWGFTLAINLLARVFPSDIRGISVPWIAAIFVVLLAGFFYVRLCMVFPATAIDHKTSLVDAWNLTSNSAAQILLALVLPIIVLVGIYIFLSVPFRAVGHNAQIFLSEIMRLVSLLVTICVLSVSYRTLAKLDSVESSD